MEADDAFFPSGIVELKFFDIALDNLLVKFVILKVLQFVTLFILLSVLNQELIDLGLQQERDIDQIVSQFVEETCGALLLKGFQRVEIGSQLV